MIFGIGVGSFSKLGGGGGGGKPSAANFNTWGGGLPEVHIQMREHAHVCTPVLHTHVFNIHTPMHACTTMYACIHSLCKHTYYILI